MPDPTSPQKPAEAGDPTTGTPAPLDVVIERTHPGSRPADTDGPNRTRHAIRLYREAVALVLPIDHELADPTRGGATEVEVADLDLVTLLDHPDHAPEWPRPQPWADPAWMPRDAAAALALVATGAGGVLLPLPLARHLAARREHAVIPVVAAPGDPQLAATEIWATWALDRDAPDIQQLAGIMRGRTARSQRSAGAPQASKQPQPSAAKKTPKKQGAKKQGPKPGSRGAQLAAAREKAERAKAARRRAKKKR